MRIYEKYIKRFLDIVLSAVAIVIFCPLMLIIAMFVKVKLGGPVIFQQKRPGKDEKLFCLYKFRTMMDIRNESGDLLSDEERLTKFGRLLRSTSLDELPEFINILIGDMSIVGPRPLLVRYLPFFESKERVRHAVRPGLTGLAQVSGRNNLEWNERLALDVVYTENISFHNDLMIILKTICHVIKRKDITSGDQMDMKDLDVERVYMRERE